jgi:hypothetical protein
MMNQLLKTIDITRNRSSFENTIETVEAEIHIIAINSDLFFTASENKATLKSTKRIKKVSYQEIVSIHGHDAFDRIQTITHIFRIFLKLKTHNTMKILKFGGKSLSNGDGLNKVVAIITDKINQGEEIAIVVSARGNATDELANFNSCF